MDNSKKEIGEGLEQIRDALGIEIPNSEKKESISEAWYVGACGNDDDGNWTDFSDDYISKGIWENRYTNGKYADLVNSIKAGERIAIKASYIRKNGLPFDNSNKTVGVMSIKAIGTVISNDNNGKSITVKWEKIDPIKEWYGFCIIRGTISLVRAADGLMKKQLLDFTFGNGVQDLSSVEDKYKDEESSEQDDEPENPEEVPLSDKIINHDLDDRVSSGENVILYGVPGSGKSYTIQKEYCSDDERIERVVFHPDFTYSDFVGQILPCVEKNGTVTYKFVPGPFTKILKKAYIHADQAFYLIIEEVNRGNAPAIFGDVFQLLDRLKDGTSAYGITNADMAKEVYGDPEHQVKIPSNLSILCTMNTSDQNVFTLDTAFQRRWDMRLIENSFKKDTIEEKDFAETKILDTDVTWETFCEKMNKYILDRNITMTSAEDKRLGTHFVQESDLVFDSRIDDTKSDDLTKTKAKLHNSKFPEKVIKYLWDDAFKFNRIEIFDTNKFNSLESIIHEFTTKRNDDRFDIFVENIRADLEAIASESNNDEKKDNNK